VVISSTNAAGAMDVSPKGDPPGFVKVLDKHTLAVPDRIGNHRGDTFMNVLENPSVGTCSSCQSAGKLCASPAWRKW
jgi:predicted pyridoxine 5'-phosphate oxidase superfamily flavin-nucleotide-binding protein